MLKEKLKQDLREAMKEKKEGKISALRMVLASILNEEKEKRYRLSREKPELTGKLLDEESELTDEEIIEVIFSGVKKRKEAIEEFKRGNREDLAEKEQREIEILKKYLPEQFSEEEIRKKAIEVIEAVGAKEPRDIGRVMSQLMPKLKGRAEGGVVSKIVKEILLPKEN